MGKTPIRNLVDVNVTLAFNSCNTIMPMPALRSTLNARSDAFAANSQRMVGLLAEVQRLENIVIAESQSKRAKFEERPVAAA